MAEASQVKHWTDAYVDDLRERAEMLKTYGDERGAQIALMHADELLARRAAYDSEEIDVDEAAEVSGYHPETLRRLKREGRWSGRRGDLPRHERRASTLSIPEPPAEGGSLADQINRRALRGKAG